MYTISDFRGTKKSFRRVDERLRKCDNREKKKKVENSKLARVRAARKVFDDDNDRSI